MGLAASQARMLLLTARKSDVESSLTSIANQKLSISRQSAKLSDEYSNALNKQRLQWTDSTSGDLNYNEMIGSSTIATGAAQYAIVNGNGQVVLSNAMASQLGLNGVTPTTATNFNNIYKTPEAFIATAMGTTNTTDVKKLLDGINGTTPATENNYAFTTVYKDSQVFEYMATKSNGMLTPAIDIPKFNKGGINYNSDPNAPQVMCFLQGTATDGSGLNNYDRQCGINNISFAVEDITADASKAVLATLQKNGKYSAGTIAKLTKAAATAADRTTANYTNLMAGHMEKEVGTGSGPVLEKTVSDSNGVFNEKNGNSELYIDMTQVIKTFLNYFDSECSKIDADDNTNAKVHELMNFGTSKDLPSGSGLSEKFTAIRALGVGGTAVFTGNGMFSATTNFAISAGNILLQARSEIFSTLTVDEIDTYNKNTDAAKKAQIDAEISKRATDILASKYSCSDSSYSATPTTPASLDAINKNNITDTLEVNYYKNLYEALSSSGWTQDDNVTKRDYLDQQLQNGKFFLYSYNNGWKNASSNCSGSPLELVEDTEAVAKAKADYDSGKDKLDYKESKLDIEMNNLDTERSAIETESDSVQKLIDKNIEKFKIFQA